MVKVKGIEAELVTAETSQELLRAVVDEMQKLKGYSPQLAQVSATSVVIYHDEIEPFEEATEWEGRHCCECGAYEWGKGCPYKAGHITLMMDACQHFTIEVKEATK